MKANQSNNEQKRKLLEEMIKNLQISCFGKKEVDYRELGEYLLIKQEEINVYYHSATEKEILEDLKEKLQNIKSWHLLNYNKTQALSICQYLIQQEKNHPEQQTIYHPPSSSSHHKGV